MEHKIKVFDRKSDSFLDDGKDMTVQDIVDCSEFTTMVDSFTDVLLVSDKKDLQGNMITEGDIVEIIYEKQPDGFGKFEVVFEKSAFRLKVIEKNWAIIVEDGTCIEDFEEMRIIGNIFEKDVDNPTGL